MCTKTRPKGTKDIKTYFAGYIEPIMRVTHMCVPWRTLFKYRARLESIYAWCLNHYENHFGCWEGILGLSNYLQTY